MNTVTNPDPLRPWRDGDVWENAATGLRLRIEQAAARTQGATTVWMATYPPYSPTPPSHVHPHQTENFTILEGSMRIRHRGVTRDLARGDTLRVDPGEPHAMWNPHPAPAEVRWATTPALRTEQWMGLLLALAASGRTKPNGTPTFLDLAWMLRTYRTELRLVRPAPWVQVLIFAPAAWLASFCNARRPVAADSRRTPEPPVPTAGP